MDSSFDKHGLDESAFEDKGLSSLRTFDAFREYPYYIQGGPITAVTDHGRPNLHVVLTSRMRS